MEIKTEQSNENKKLRNIIETNISMMQDFHKFLFSPIDKNLSAIEFSEAFDEHIRKARGSVYVTCNAIDEMFKLRK